MPRPIWRAATQAGVTGLLLALTACAQNQTAHSPPFPSDTPPVYTAEVRPPRVEMEADGLPVQLALRDRKPVADDPSEPWSPNYGAVRTRTPAQPAPTTVSVATVERIAIFQPRPIDEDDIIRHAITEHEMRQEN